MMKLQRLTLIKSGEHMKHCRVCKMTYMPFSLHAETNCPKCKPEDQESDEDYLNNENLETEEISNDEMFDDFPRERYM